MSSTDADSLAKARIAAKLKREKKAEATLARQKGKEQAKEARNKTILQEKNAMDQEQILLQKKIAKARKSLGVRANEPNPYGLERQIEQWRFEMYQRLGYVPNIFA
jgi:hypothetical protein